jgi:hypothetical protein
MSIRRAHPHLDIVRPLTEGERERLERLDIIISL